MMYKDIFISVCLIIAIAIYIQFNIYIVSDNAWLLYVSQFFLKHGKYGINFVETTPVIILYIYAPVIFLHKYFNYFIYKIFDIYILFLGFISLILTFIYLKKLNKQEVLNTIQVKIFFIAIAFSLFLLPVGEFGQREHVMCILCMPYIFSAIYRLISVLKIKNNLSKLDKSNFLSFFDKILSISIGFMAGVGFCIKPQFALIPLCLEIYMLRAARTYKILINLIFISLCAASLIAICLIFFKTPEYITFILPLITNVYNKILPFQLSTIIYTYPSIIYFLFFIYFLLNEFIQKNKLLHQYVDENIDYKKYINAILFIVVSVCFFSFIIGRTLWYYHMLPMLLFMFIYVANDIFVSIVSLGKSLKDYQYSIEFKKNKLINILFQSIKLIYLIIIFFILIFVYIIANQFCFNQKNDSNSSLNTVIRLASKYSYQKTYYYVGNLILGTWPTIIYAHAINVSKFPSMLFMNISDKDYRLYDSKKSIYDRQAFGAVLEKNLFYKIFFNELTTYKPQTILFQNKTLLSGIDYYDILMSANSFRNFIRCYDLKEIAINNIKIYSRRKEC